LIEIFSFGFWVRHGRQEVFFMVWRAGILFSRSPGAYFGTGDGFSELSMKMVRMWAQNSRSQIEASANSHQVKWLILLSVRKLSLLSNTVETLILSDSFHIFSVCLHSSFKDGQMNVFQG